MISDKLNIYLFFKKYNINKNAKITKFQNRKKLIEVSLRQILIVVQKYHMHERKFHCETDKSRESDLMDNLEGMV